VSVAALSLLLLVLAVGIGVFGARAVGAVTVVESLLSGYVVTFGAVVLLVLGLSLAHALTTAALLTGLAGALFAVVLIARLRSRSGRASVRGLWRRALATTRSEPLLAPLFAVVAGTVAYSIALAIGTPPTNWDSLTYHLARIGFWLQQGSVSYIGNPYNEALNGYPPNGEFGQLLVFRTTGDERLMGLVQLVAAVVCAVGVYGLARRLANEWTALSQDGPTPSGWTLAACRREIPAWACDRQTMRLIAKSAKRRSTQTPQITRSPWKQ